MGTGKKEATRRTRQGKTGDGMANVRVKGENFYRYVAPRADSEPRTGVADRVPTAMRRGSST